MWHGENYVFNNEHYKCREGRWQGGRDRSGTISKGVDAIKSFLRMGQCVKMTGEPWLKGLLLVKYSW